MDDDEKLNCAVIAAVYGCSILGLIYGGLQYHSRKMLSAAKKGRRCLEEQAKKTLLAMRAYLVEAAMLRGVKTSIKGRIAERNKPLKTYVRELNDEQVVEEFVWTSLELGFGAIHGSMTMELLNMLQIPRHIGNFMLAAGEDEDSRKKALEFWNRLMEESAKRPLALEINERDKGEIKSVQPLGEKEKVDDWNEVTGDLLREVADCSVSKVDAGKVRTRADLKEELSQESFFDDSGSEDGSEQSPLLSDEDWDDCSDDFGVRKRNPNRGGLRYPRVAPSFALLAVMACVLMSGLSTASADVTIRDTIRMKTYYSGCPIESSISKIEGPNGLPFGWINYPPILDAILNDQFSSWDSRLTQAYGFAEARYDNDEKLFMKCYITRKAKEMGRRERLKWQLQGAHLVDQLHETTEKVGDKSNSESNDVKNSSGSSDGSGSSGSSASSASSS